MGQREHSSSRISGRPTVEVNDACSASTSTVAGFCVSGQVTIRVPRYLEEDLTSQRKPNQRATANTIMAINEPAVVYMFNPPFRRLQTVACPVRSSSISLILARSHALTSR